MSQLARLRAAQGFVEAQRKAEEQDAFDVNSAYSDVVSYTSLDEELFATMVGEDTFAKKHGIYFTHEKNLEKDKDGLTAYDKLDDYEMPGYEPGRFKIIKNVDDAQGLMSSRATNVTFNDKATGEAEIGKVARNGILIDSTTGQIHALNETRRGIFPFTLFRDNDPESPVLFTTGEGLYQTLNEALRDNIKVNPNSDLIIQARAEFKGRKEGKEISKVGTEDDQGAPVRFNDVLNNIDADVESNNTSSFEGLQAKSELWPIIQDAIDSAQEEEKKKKEEANKVFTERDKFGAVPKEDVINANQRGKLEFGTVDTSKAKYGEILDLANDIITNFEAGTPLATTYDDKDILEGFRSRSVVENNRGYNSFDSRIGAVIDLPRLNARIEELEEKPDGYTETGTSPYGYGFSRNPFTLQANTYTMTKAEMLTEVRADKVRAEKAMYDFASYVKGELVRDDLNIREVAFTEPRKRITDELERKRALLANDNITGVLREKTEKEVEALESRLTTLDEKYPELSQQYNLPPNVDKVEEMPTFKLPTKEDGSYDPEAVTQYLIDNEDEIRELIGQDTMDKVAAAFIKYGVTAERPDFRRLPFYDPELDLSASEIALGTATMAANRGTGTSFGDVYNRTWNSIVSGDPNLDPVEKYKLNRGTQIYNIQYEETALAGLRAAQADGNEVLVDAHNTFMQYINGDKQVNLYRTYDGENTDTFMSPLTADGGAARANFNGLLADLKVKGSYYGTPIMLDERGKLVHPNPNLQGLTSPLNSAAHSAMKLIVGDVLLAMAVRHGDKEKGGFFGLFSGRDNIDAGLMTSIVNNTQVVVKVGPGGKPMIDKFIFDDGTGTQYTATLPNRAFTALIPDPQDRALILNMIPQENIKGTAFNYLEIE